MPRCCGRQREESFLGVFARPFSCQLFIFLDQQTGITKVRKRGEKNPEGAVAHAISYGGTGIGEPGKTIKNPEVALA
jgi:hypothetical protein